MSTLAVCPRRLPCAGRLGRDQHAGIGACRPGQHLAARPALDDGAVAHHVDSVGDAPNEPEIVADEHERRAEAAAQCVDELENLRLDRDVESGRRFVGDDQARIVGDRHGDHHALALSAGEFVRIGAKPARPPGETHVVEKLRRAPAGLRAAQSAVRDHRLGDLGADRIERVEGRHRFLKDHRGVRAADPIEPPLRQADEFDAVELRRAANLRAFSEKPEGGEHRLRLARSRLADDSHDFVPPHGEIDAAHRRLVRVVDSETGQREEGVHLSARAGRARRRGLR